ncbi:3-demethylubiquinone-9 3-methyltransferase [Gossypium arboreum]|uniref:3-demethylubiquinone-9 3-methyltransferase n=1 Tax=Gossypium arboreum TaxID=29729 RepID=A0A0B0P554_GOSAR|nr:3-demethylubiquinone-9 3-methyltransferase [Gossypium arboreum]
MSGLPVQAKSLITKNTLSELGFELPVQAKFRPNSNYPSRLNRVHIYSSGGSIIQGTPIRARFLSIFEITDYPSGLNPYYNTCRISIHM